MDNEAGGPMRTDVDSGLGAVQHGDAPTTRTAASASASAATAAGAGPSGVDEVVVELDPSSRSSAAAFDALFRTTYPTLVRALSVAADGGAAADAVQDAFVQASLHWPRVGRLDNPAAWVRRAAINRLANHRRGLRRRAAAVARLHPVDEAATIDPADLDLAAALRALPQKQRMVVCLHYLADLSVAEIADSMGVAEGTVKSNLHDARRALRAHLGEPSDG
jgi:RNA polymerase sigma-70 factor (ECF subfamily)